MHLYGKHPKPLYMAWAALALNVQARATGEKPSSIATGGGRGLTTCRLEGPAASSLVLAERMLQKALNVASSTERDSEMVGLFIHTLVRQGKAAQAYQALMGPYCSPVAEDASETGSPSQSTPEDVIDAEGTSEYDGSLLFCLLLL